MSLKEIRLIRRIGSIGLLLFLVAAAATNPRAKAAKPEQFFDGTILKEIEKSGFVAKLYQK